MKDYLYEHSEEENDDAIPLWGITVSIHEDNRSGIHAIVEDGSVLVNVIPHLEMECLTGSQIIAEAKDGFKGWGEYDAVDFDDQDCWGAQHEFETYPVIVVVHGGEVDFYPENFRENGRRLFGKLAVQK